MNAAVSLMDGLGLDGDRCIRMIPRQIELDIHDNSKLLKHGNFIKNTVNICLMA